MSVEQLCELPPRQPAPLTEDSLRMHNLLPATTISSWAGAKSQLYLVFFQEGAQAIYEALQSPVLLRAPTGESKARSWPYNAIVDWCWGAHILTAFGSDHIKNFAKGSVTTAWVQRWRKQKRMESERGEVYED